MRLVEDPADLADLFQAASQEAQAAFGDGGMYLEKAVVAAHHVEIQVICDAFGGVLICGERECSIQRRHQKLLAEAAERACRAISYLNAGSIEFLVGADRRFYFMEMNTRLQVEHPVTEAVTGIDLVREQLRVAAGERLSHTGRAAMRGHAIEFRVNAEDPSKGFLPSAGLVTSFEPPLGPGVRVDTHAYSGYRIPPTYDSLLAKVIVHAEDRESCIGRSRRAFGELNVEGVKTTAGLHLDVIWEARFRLGT